VNDTEPWAAEAVAELMRQRTPGERVRMASSMFATARELMLAGLRAEHPDASPEEMRMLVLERTYRADFSEEEWARVERQMRAAISAGR
jgi:hypothetical protein